jgi:hypothetical protein
LIRRNAVRRAARMVMARHGESPGAEHRAKMRAAQTYDECKAAMDQHREQMAARAKERGVAALPGPRRDPCAGLKR